MISEVIGHLLNGGLIQSLGPRRQTMGNSFLGVASAQFL